MNNQGVPVILPNGNLVIAKSCEIAFRPTVPGYILSIWDCFGKENVVARTAKAIPGTSPNHPALNRLKGIRDAIISQIFSAAEGTMVDVGSIANEQPFNGMIELNFDL